jgi:hypothetical protein
MAEVGVDEDYMAQLKRQEEDRRQSCTLNPKP